MSEAIRLVERHQIAETRRGAVGGLFVAQPAKNSVARVMSSYLESIGLEIGELFEARHLIDGSLAGFAALRSRREDSLELESILEEQLKPGDVEESRDLFARFDMRLGELAESPVLALYARALREVTDDISYGVNLSLPDQREIYRALRESRQRIAKAIIQHAGDRAERYHGQLLDREEEVVRTEPRRKREWRGIKRGDALARQISAAIRARKFALGDSLGTEPELLDRYQVSRAAFREGVRMLEQYGIVEMIRGSGLIVTEPDPGAVTRSAYAYLTHLDVTPGALLEASTILEPTAASFAATRASDEQLAELMTQLGVLLTLPEADAGDAARALHEQIPLLAKNRALMLFARVGTTAAWGLGPVPRRDLPSDSLDSVRGSWLGIVGAIRVRDANLASRLMKDYIELIHRWIHRLRHGQDATRVVAAKR